MIRFLLASATFLFLSLVSAPSAVEIGYTATDLGSVTGVALNDTGQIVGWRPMAEGFDLAFISGPNGVGIRSLGALPGDRFSHATGINNSGQVTGFSELHPTDEDHLGIPHAFLSEPNGGPLHDSQAHSTQRRAMACNGATIPPCPTSGGERAAHDLPVFHWRHDARFS